MDETDAFPAAALGEPLTLAAARQALARTAARLEAALQSKAELEAKLAAADGRLGAASSERAEEFEFRRGEENRRRSQARSQDERERALQEELQSARAENAGLSQKRGAEDSRLVAELEHFRAEADAARRDRRQESERLGRELDQWRFRSEEFAERIRELERRLGESEGRAREQAARLWERENALDLEKVELRRELAAARERLERQSETILAWERRLPGREKD